MVPKLAVEEKEQEILAKEETIQVLLLWKTSGVKFNI